MKSKCYEGLNKDQLIQIGRKSSSENLLLDNQLFTTENIQTKLESAQLNQTVLRQSAIQQ